MRVSTGAGAKPLRSRQCATSAPAATAPLIATATAIDRALHAEEREQQHRANETGGAGAERVDVVEEAHGAADALPERRTRWATSTGSVAPISSVGTSTRPRLTAAIAGSGQAGGQLADLVEDRQREDAESAGQDFDNGKQRQQRNAAPLRQPSAQQGCRGRGRA